ncbi:MAG: hypothetical protein ABIZ34_00060 [Candidatus Limnocylindrales bacterium]
MPEHRAASRLVAVLTAAVAALFLVGTSASAAAIPDFGTEPVEDSTAPEGSSIVDIRVGENDGFDRFVIEYEGSVGSYFIQYVDEVSEDPSGAPVSVEGTAFIRVSVGGIPDEPPAPQETINAGLSGLIQVVGAGAHFEGTVAYALGTGEAAGFRAFTLTDPGRLVVDIAHPDVVPTATNTVDPTAPQTTAEASETDPQGTPTEASENSDSSNSWLLFLVVGLVVFALVTGILGWRMRNPNPRQR